MVTKATLSPERAAIIKEFAVKRLVTNVAEEVKTRVQFLKDALVRTGANGFILGISGGQDSALAGKLAQLACTELTAETGKQYTFVAARLPYGVQRDAEDARKVAEEFIKANEMFDLDIKPGVDAVINSWEEFRPIPKPFNPAQQKSNTTEGLIQVPVSDFVKGNLKARIRMTTQYMIAGERNLLVIGADNACERLTGFFTKWGDGAADIMPIGSLTKGQGRLLLNYLKAPEFLKYKAPTADLLDGSPGETDEFALNVSYDVLDAFLEGAQVTAENEAHILALYAKTAHKRDDIPSI